jgi:hypothetical protein
VSEPRTKHFKEDKEKEILKEEERELEVDLEDKSEEDEEKDISELDYGLTWE